ncbi:MAG TPA: hypothetical protein VHK24_13220 [Steroidobacter sp.]|nr:hypothetical protein [Steroidobacter sp.]
MFTRLLSIFLLCLLWTGFATADDREKSSSAEATFSSLDKDADQRLSKTEASGDKMLTDHFAAIDADGDSYLTKREYTEHMKAMGSATKSDY